MYKAYNFLLYNPIVGHGGECLYNACRGYLWNYVTNKVE